MRLRDAAIEDIRAELDLIMQERGLARLRPLVAWPYRALRAYLLAILRDLGRSVWP